MRIAYVINSMEGGGAALPIVNIAAAMTAQGAEVRVLALTRRDGHAMRAIRDAGFGIEVRAGGERDHVAALRWLSARVAEWRPRLIWTSLTRATLLGQQVGARFRIPVVSWQHSMGLKPANLLLLRMNRRRSALWVADSASVAGLVRERLGVDQARIAIWPIFRADPTAPAAARWQPGEPVRIGSLGRLHPVKGYHVLIEALRLLSTSGSALAPWTASIAGDGAEREALRRQAELAGVPIRLTGFERNPPAYLSNLHLYVQPSLHEGFCVAGHEAMQAGLPVVASDVGEMRHSVARGGGWLVEPGDAVVLAGALRDALAKPARLDAVGAAGRAHALEQFGPERFGSIAREIFDGLRTRGILRER